MPRLVVLALLVAVVAVLPVMAQVPAGDGTDRWLKLQWELEGGKISGRIFNQYQSPADQVRLLIEAVDASERVVNQSYEWVGGAIPALGDRSFTFNAPPGGNHYRVAVASYTFIQDPGFQRGRFHHRH